MKTFRNIIPWKVSKSTTEIGLAKTDTTFHADINSMCSFIHAYI